MKTHKNFDYEKLTKEQKECLSLVESLGVYELRALSRVFGYSSPTTLKRDDHIKIIMEKIISKEELRPLPLKQGRPYKELSNIEGILVQLSKITGVDYTMQSGKEVGGKKNITFKQVDEKIFSKKMSPINVKGFLLENLAGQFYFRNQFNGRNVLVSGDLAKNLVEYDYVEGEAVVMNSEKEYMMTKLVRTNFQPAEKYNGKAVSTAQSSVNLGKTTINLGQRYRFANLTRFSDKQEEITKLCKSFKEAKIPTILIAPNVAEEDLMTFQLMGFDCPVTFSMTDDAEDVYENIVYTIDFMKRQRSLGGSVAVFIQDPVTFANLVDYCFKNNPKVFMNHTDNVARIVKEFASLMRQNSKQNVTIFSTCDSADLFDPLYVSLVYKIYRQINL